MMRAAAGAGCGDGGGTIVNVTVSPHHGMPAMAHTGAARAAVEALTRELAEEWRARGTAVTAAAIGRFDTRWSPRRRGTQLIRSVATSVAARRGWRGAPEERR
jgi:citronellol/citronellal dehydrogenase